MTFFILDPSLRNGGGHHFEFDATIAAAAHSTGQNVLMFAHKDCVVANANGAAIIPWFSHHLYEDKKSILGYGISNFLFFNFSFYRDLRRLHKAVRFQPQDIILAPTLCENQLFGLVRWAARFQAAHAPLFIVYLMFSPDFWLSDRESSSAEPALTERALFYRLAYQCAATVEATVRIFGGGRQIAREFSALTHSAIEAHPLPLSLIPPEPRVGDSDRPTTLLFAGAAKRDKGFLFLPDLAEQLSEAHPNHQFLIHVDFSAASTQADLCSAYKRLQDLPTRRPNVIVLSGELDRKEYIAFIKRADCFVCTYDPITYARKTSGVVWEAISLGMPILAPANTFAHRELVEWGAGHGTYAIWSVAGISSAYSLFCQRICELADTSRCASERFQNANNAAALSDHLSRIVKERPISRFLNPMRRLRRSRAHLILAWLTFRIGQKWRRGGGAVLRI